MAEKKGKEGYDRYGGGAWKQCPKCGTKSYITIEPFEGSYYYCPKCKDGFGFRGIC